MATGCNQEPTEEIDRMLDEAAKGLPELFEKNWAEVLEEVKPEVEKEVEKLAEKELGLQREEVNNRELVEERIRGRFAHICASEDGINCQLISQNSPAEFGRENRAVAKEYTACSRKYERNQLVERIGVIGAERLCEMMGYQPLQKDKQKGCRHYLDSVWQDPRTNEVVVVEEKGGQSQPSELKSGEKQGTIMYAVDRARGVLISKTTSEVEKTAAHIVLLAHKKITLRCELIRTTHQEGTPGTVKIESTDAVKHL